MDKMIKIEQYANGGTYINFRSSKFNYKTRKLLYDKTYYNPSDSSLDRLDKIQYKFKTCRFTLYYHKTEIKLIGYKGD